VTEYRAHFDAEVEFVNGGGLHAEGFRLDLPSADLGEARVAQLFVRHLGLALVGRVALANLQIVEEPHRGSRGATPDSYIPHDTPPPAGDDPAGRADLGVRQHRGELVDLSHAVRAGLVTYPGLPAPTVTPFLTRAASREHYEAGTEFAIDVITMPGNTGTYLDSPFHRYADGGDLASLSLETLVGVPAEVFHLADAADRGIPAEVFFDRELAGTAVLLHTGWSRHFGMPEYAHGAPFLTEAGARHLAEAGVTIVGIDSLNIDDTESGGSRPAHSILLAAGVHVVEHLTALDRLPARGARFTAVPPRVEGFGTFPVRAFAEVPGVEGAP